MKNRGIRLEQEKKKKARVKRFIKDSWYLIDEEQILSDKNIGKIAHTPHACSCRCCGNPRRHEKGKASKTIQELRNCENKTIIEND